MEAPGSDFTPSSQDQAGTAAPDSSARTEHYRPMHVVLRIRPMNIKEKEMQCENIVEVSGNTVTLSKPEADGRTSSFTFDSVLGGPPGGMEREAGAQAVTLTDQERLCQYIGQPMVEQAFAGLNTSALAYGQTGTGKSFTMLGIHGTHNGLIHYFSKQLFEKVASSKEQKFKVTFSMLEIRFDQVHDLLSKNSVALKIRHTSSTGPVHVENLTVVPVRSLDQMQQLFDQGMMNRTIAMTMMNAASSRSHLIVTIHFHQYIMAADGKRIMRKSKIRFLDMAGSERATKTGATGQSLKEAANINKSFGALSNVISILASQDDKAKFIPYRSSKLTLLLKEELGGNCVTTFIASISPADYNYSESQSTLNYAKRARLVPQKPMVNDLDVDVVIRKWKADISSIESQMAATKIEEEKTNFRSKIEKLKASIQRLDLAWKEKEATEKGGIWWSTTLNLQQPELENWPFLQNISEEAHLSGTLKYSLPEGYHLLGRSETPNVTIELTCLGIQALHALVTVKESTLIICPYNSRALVHVNGRQVFSPTTLNHLDHVKLGAHEFFLVIGFPSSRTKMEKFDSSNHSYEKCLTELAENHPLYQSLRPTPEMNAREKTGALLLVQNFTNLLPQLAQAHAIAACLGKNIDFGVEVLEVKQMQKLHVKVNDKDLGVELTYSQDKFESHKLSMDEVYQQMLTKGQVPMLDKESDPFSFTGKLDICLGSGTVYLNNLFVNLPVEDTVPLVGNKGEPVATISYAAKLFDKQGEPVSKTLGTTLQDPNKVLSQAEQLTFSICGFSDVLWTATNAQRQVYCKVLVKGESKSLQTRCMGDGKMGEMFLTEFTLNLKALSQSVTEGVRLELWGSQMVTSTPCSTDVLQSVNTPSPDATMGDGKDGRGLVMDLSLAQDLKLFFKNVSPVKHRLQSLTKLVNENNKSKDGRPLPWTTDCVKHLQAAEHQLDKSVLALKSSVKTAVRRTYKDV